METNVSAFLAHLQANPARRREFEVVWTLPLTERLQGLLALSGEVGLPVSVSNLKEYADLDERADAALVEGRYPLIIVSELGPKKAYQEFLSHFRIRHEGLETQYCSKQASGFKEDTEVQLEIQAAVMLLDLKQEEFRKLLGPDVERVNGTCYREFLKTSREVRWWWEHFREPQRSFVSDGPASILEYVPNPDLPCYFIVEDDCAPFYPVYVATPRKSVAVLLECFGFEYYLVSFDFNWIICENHHNEVMGIGEALISK